MKIKTQFILTMLLFGIILAITASSAIIMNLRLDHTLEQEAIARNIAQGASELGYLTNDYLIYRESQQLNRWQARFTSVSEQVGKLKGDAPEQRALAQNIQVNQRRLKEVFDSVASALGNSSTSKKATLDPALLQVSWSRMAVQSQGLVSDAARLSQLLDQQVEQLTETRTRLIYFLVGVFGLFLLASYMLTYRRILKSIAAFQLGTRVIGYGDLDFKIEEKKNDEIGDLSRAFNQMAAGLKAVTASKADLEHEIAERKRAEEALRATHAQAVWLARFPEQNPNPILRASTDGTVLYCNPASAKLSGWSCDAGRVVPKGLLPLVGRAMAEGTELQQDVQLGEKFYIVWVSPFPKEGYANVYGSDITERKQAEQKLRESQERYRTLFEAMTEGFAVHEIICDEKGVPCDYRFLDVNSAFEHLTGLKRSDLLGRRVREVLPGIEAYWIENYGKVALTGEPVYFENFSAALDRWYEVLAYRPAVGRFAVLFTDITARKRAEDVLREREQRISASLREKEVLLKEIHHRVKNNMQVISSLVALQADELQDAATRAVLMDLTHRVRSMAMVHEKLYQSVDLARVEFAEYARSLLNYLWRAHGNAASGVQLAMNLEPVSLAVNEAVPCGLILNELVSNALKHAFCGSAGGDVAVSLCCDEESRIVLRVRDNGAGLPPGFDWRQSRSLGLRLVQMLAGQLHAAVDVSAKGGTEFAIRFGGPKT